MSKHDQNSYTWKISTAELLIIHLMYIILQGYVLTVHMCKFGHPQFLLVMTQYTSSQQIHHRKHYTSQGPAKYMLYTNREL